MKAKTLQELHGRGAVVNESGASIPIVEKNAAPIAAQLGVPTERLVEVINSNSKALLLIVEALASQMPAPSVTVNIPPTKSWVIDFQRDKNNQISRAVINPG